MNWPLMGRLLAEDGGVLKVLMQDGTLRSATDQEVLSVTIDRGVAMMMAEGGVQPMPVGVNVEFLNGTLSRERDRMALLGHVTTLSGVECTRCGKDRNHLDHSQEGMVRMLDRPCQGKRT